LVWGGRYGIAAFISEERRNLETAKLHGLQASLEESEEAIKTHKKVMTKRLEQIAANQGKSKTQSKLQRDLELFKKEKKELEARFDDLRGGRNELEEEVEEYEEWAEQELEELTNLQALGQSDPGRIFLLDE